VHQLVSDAPQTCHKRVPIRRNAANYCCGRSIPMRQVCAFSLLIPSQCDCIVVWHGVVGLGRRCPIHLQVPCRVKPQMMCSRLKLQPVLNANNAVATQQFDNLVRHLLIRAPSLPQAQQDLANDCLESIRHCEFLRICVLVCCDFAINCIKPAA